MHVPKSLLLALLTITATALIVACGDDDSTEADATFHGSGSTAEKQQEEVEEVTTERIPLAAAVDPKGAKGYTLQISDVVIAPGDVLDPHFHEGTQTAHIDSGTLTYTVIEGEVPVYTGSPEEDPELVTEIGAGDTFDIEPGMWVIEEAKDKHTAENATDEPIEISLTALLVDGAPASTPYEPDAAE